MVEAVTEIDNLHVSKADWAAEQTEGAKKKEDAEEKEGWCRRSNTRWIWVGMF